MAKDDSAPPNRHRRNFLRGIAAFAAQSAMPLPAWVTDAAKSTNPAGGPIIDWILSHHGFNDFSFLSESSPEEFLDAKQFFIGAGRALNDVKPSYDNVLGFLRFLSAKDTEGAYQTFLGERTAEEAAQELYRISQLSPEAVVAHVETEIKNAQLTYTEYCEDLERDLSQRKAAPQKLPTYRDMAAARKAGGYPVPQQCLGLPSSRVGTHHATSGEWSERIEISPVGTIKR